MLNDKISSGSLNLCIISTSKQFDKSINVNGISSAAGAVEERGFFAGVCSTFTEIAVSLKSKLIKRLPEETCILTP